MRKPEEFFDQASGTWSSHYRGRGFLAHFFRARMEAVSRLIPFNKNGKLLDAGCGTGDYFPVARSRGYSFHGIDISQKMVDASRKRFPEGEFRKADLEDPGFGEGEFDVIISAGTLEYVRDDFRASRELFRILRSNGLLIATFPNRSSPFLRLEKRLSRLSPKKEAFHREYTSSRARKVLESAGFRILEERHVSFLPVNLGLRLPFPRAIDRLLGRTLSLLGLGSWGLTRIISARK